MGLKLRTDVLQFLRAVRILTLAVVSRRLLPYAVLVRVWRPRVAHRAQPAAVDAWVRALDRASTVVPGGGNCFARALAGRSLLAREGVHASIVFGVKRSALGLESHAWLRSGERTVLGQHGGDAFAPLDGDVAW